MNPSGTVTTSTAFKILIVAIAVLVVSGKKADEKASDVEDDEENFDADVFCKSQNRLIRMKKSDDIYVVHAFINNSVLLQCKYCEEKDNGQPKIWSKQKHIFKGEITEVEPNVDGDSTTASVFVSQRHSLVLRSLQESDAGLYFCRVPFTDTPDQSWNYLIDLSNNPGHEVKGTLKEFKNYTEFYLGRVNEMLANQTFLVNKILVKMKVFTDWSEWSECDSCFRKEGIKYRTGRCRVKPISLDLKDRILIKKKIKFHPFNVKKIRASGTASAATCEASNVIKFGIVLSCRSLLLQNYAPEFYNITAAVPDFVLSDKCSASCNGKISKKGPRYKKSIILARGAHLTLVCPDSTTDSQVQWQHNKLPLYPNEGTDYIVGSTEPRLYVDSFNTLYLFEVTDRESGNFTCFVNGVRMQEVRIMVLTRSLFFTKEFTRHLKYLGFVFFICFVGYLTGVTVMCLRSHSEKKRNVRKIHPNAEKFLKKKSKGNFDCESP